MSQGFQAFTPRDMAQPQAKVAAPPVEPPQAWQPPGIGGSRPAADASLASLGASSQQPKGAATLDAAVKDELETLREQARQQGFAKGEADAQALLAQQSQQLQLAIAALRQPMMWLEGEVETQLLDLCCALTKALLGRELSADPQWLRARLHDAVALLPVAEGRIDLHLNPEDAALLREAAEQGEPLDPAWVLHDDPEIQRGGSLIKNAQSQVDHRLEARLARLLAPEQASEDE